MKVFGKDYENFGDFMNTGSKDAWQANFKDMGSLVSGIGTATSGIAGIISPAMDNTKLRNVESYDLLNNNLRNRSFNAGDNEQLMSLYDGTNFNYNPIEASDLRLSDRDRWLNTGKGIASGAMAGLQIGGGWGALVGGVLGLGAGIGSILSGNAKSREGANRIGSERALANGVVMNNINNNHFNINRNNYYRTMRNIASDGGPLFQSHGGLFKPANLRFINAGGTHEENPYEGVLQGYDPQGTPNMVEEGEVVFNDYVYSNRLKPDPEKLKAAGIKAYKNKTYADIAKNLTKESEESPMDAIAKRTMNVMMQKLAAVQEQQKQEEAMNQAMASLQGQLNLAACGGKLNKKACGGKINKYEPGGPLNSYEEMMKSVADKVGHKSYVEPWMSTITLPEFNPMLDADASLRAKSFAANNKAIQNMVDSFSDNVDFNKALSVLDEILTEPFMPISAANAFVNWQNRKDSEPIKTNTVSGNSIASRKRATPFTNEELQAIIDKTAYDITHPFGLPEGKNLAPLTADVLGGIQPDVVNDITTFNNNKKDFLAKELERGQTIMDNPDKLNTLLNTNGRYANVLGGLASIFDIAKRADYSQFEPFEDAINNTTIPSIKARPISGRMRYTPEDINLTLNSLRNNANAARRGYMNTGNAGQAAVSLLASDMNTANALGQAIVQGRQANDQIYNTASQFNSAIDQFNAQQGLQSDAYYAQFKQREDEQKLQSLYNLANARYNIDLTKDAADSQNITNILDNISNIGRENFIMNQINTNKALNYRSRNNGGSEYKYDPELISALAEELRGYACGGKLKKKK